MKLQSLEKIDATLAMKRGEGTRYALIMAGLELFGEYGVKATTTRMLAERADANISAIPYYFDNKDGLYIAVVTYIAEQMQRHVGDKAKSIAENIDLSHCNSAQAKDAYHEIMDVFITLFLLSDEPKAWARIVVREQLYPTDAFDILYEQGMRPMQDMMSALMAKILPKEINDKELTIRSHALFGQVLGFLVSREALLRGLEKKKLTQADFAMIRDVVHAHIEACLNVQGA